MIKFNARKSWNYALAVTLALLMAPIVDAQDAAPEQSALPESVDETSIQQDFEALIKRFNSHENGVTPLMLSAQSNNLRVLEQRIAAGTDVNQTNRHGWTPLMLAAGKGHGDAVVLLLNAGADPNIVSNRITGNTQAPTPRATALSQAIENNHIGVAKMLLARGAGADPIAVAIAGGLDDLGVLKTLQYKGADLMANSGVAYYPTALDAACLSGRLHNVKWLIENAVKPTASALQAAVGRDHPNIVQYLIGAAADDQITYSDQALSKAFLFAATKNNSAPLDYDDNLEIIKMLLNSGADPNYRSSDGYSHKFTALEFLAEQRTHSLERIRLNRYDDREYEQAWLHHRDAIVQLIEGQM